MEIPSYRNTCTNGEERYLKFECYKHMTGYNEIDEWLIHMWKKPHRRIGWFLNELGKKEILDSYGRIRHVNDRR